MKLSKLSNTNLIYCMLGISFSLFAFPLHALLPPYYQSKNELLEILNSDEVANKMTSGRLINSIEKTDFGYKMTARECTLEIFVNYKKRNDGLVGPAEFEIKTGDFKCYKEP
jgi:hypothetical protein